MADAEYRMKVEDYYQARADAKAQFYRCLPLLPAFLFLRLPPLLIPFFLAVPNYVKLTAKMCLWVDLLIWIASAVLIFYGRKAVSQNDSKKLRFYTKAMTVVAVLLLVTSLYGLYSTLTGMRADAEEQDWWWWWILERAASGLGLFGAVASHFSARAARAVADAVDASNQRKRK
jgi:hypothetical protein